MLVKMVHLLLLLRRLPSIHSRSGEVVLNQHSNKNSIAFKGVTRCFVSCQHRPNHYDGRIHKKNYHRSNASHARVQVMIPTGSNDKMNKNNAFQHLGSSTLRMQTFSSLRALKEDDGGDGTVGGNGYGNNHQYEEDDEMMLSISTQNEDYLDYISSQYENNINNDSDNSTNNNRNDNDHSMIHDLFQNDFPASLPLSEREKEQTRKNFEFNHYQYSNQNRQQRRPPPKAASPPRLPKVESKLETKPQGLDETLKVPSPSPSSSSSEPVRATTTEKEVLQFTIHQMKLQIYKENNNVQFNILSPKQVSNVLFGVDNESTNREVLEGLTGNLIPLNVNQDGSSKNIAQLAKLILEFRRLNSKLRKLERDEKNKLNGSHVNHAGHINVGADQVVGKRRNYSSGSPSMSPGDDTDTTGTYRSRNTFVPNELTLGHKHHHKDKDAIEPLVLIDASAYIFRAYYSMPAIHRHDGEPTGATLGFCNMLNRLVMTPSFLQQDKQSNTLPPRIVLVFDSKDGGNFRKKIFPEYKANRKPCPIDLIPQFDFVRDAADAYGIVQLEAPGFEADDVIATIATKALDEGCFVNILSGDKDLMQLVTQEKEVVDGNSNSHDQISGSDAQDIYKPCVQLIDPMSMVRFDYNGVIEKWGVQPEKLGDVLALAGDKADNIPGVPGIGPKIAASLIQDYGSLEDLLKNLDSVKQKGRRDKLKENIEMVSNTCFQMNTVLFFVFLTYDN